jgi:hypothetical protein
MEWKEVPKLYWYTVVENAGYEGERDIKTGFARVEPAWNWAACYYTADELLDLHVHVRRDSPEGNTYEY